MSRTVAQQVYRVVDKAAGLVYFCQQRGCGDNFFHVNPMTKAIVCNRCETPLPADIPPLDITPVPGEFTYAVVLGDEDEPTA